MRAKLKELEEKTQLMRARREDKSKKRLESRFQRKLRREEKLMASEAAKEGEEGEEEGAEGEEFEEGEETFQHLPTEENEEGGYEDDNSKPSRE